MSNILLAAYQHHPKRIKRNQPSRHEGEPALTTDVLDTALSVAPDDCEEIAAWPLKLNTAYIDDIVAVAAQHAPESSEVSFALQLHRT